MVLILSSADFTSIKRSILLVLPISLFPAVLLSTSIIVSNIIVNSIVNIVNITNIKWLIVGRVYGETKIDCCLLCLAEMLHLNTLMKLGY